MKPLFVFATAAALIWPLATFAADGTTESAADRWQADPNVIFDATEVELGEFKWLARPVLVFADTDRNPDFQRQIRLLEDRIDDLTDRDVVVITDSDPEAMSVWRTKLRPRGFMLAVIGKDGQVKLRKPSPWDVREITRSIDKMPLRQQELRDQQSAVAD